MLRIRLQRRGKTGYATFRVVVAERGAPVKGKFVADLGPYNPHTDAFTVDKDKALAWINKGAQPSPTVHNLMVQHKIIKGEKVTSWRPKKKEGEEAVSQPKPEVKAETAESKKSAEPVVEEKPAEKVAEVTKEVEKKEEVVEEKPEKAAEKEAPGEEVKSK